MVYFLTFDLMILFNGLLRRMLGSLKDISAKKKMSRKSYLLFRFQSYDWLYDFDGLANTR